jgi:cellulose synthase/poly-beta-1,6-N-acetylglucosamine synthase-like glycosyltransferase
MLQVNPHRTRNDGLHFLRTIVPAKPSSIDAAHLTTQTPEKTRSRRKKYGRKRQWGTEYRTEPLPITHPRPREAKIAAGRIAIVVTVLAWIAYVISTVLREFLDHSAQGFHFTMDAVSYLVVVTFLTFSALMYLIARQGAFLRFRKHARVPRAELDRHFATHRSSMTVLVPSYAEETAVIRKTLWSAALQEYPDLRVVLLLDDPPFPTKPAEAARLEQTRAIADSIARALERPRTRLNDARVVFEIAADEGETVSGPKVRELAGHYDWAADWLMELARGEQRTDHVDDFFVSRVLSDLADELTLTARALSVAADQGEAPSQERMRELYRRLSWIFTAELSTFERKRYASLSKESNKAMNLNSYLGLMGRRFDIENTPGGPILRQVADAEPAQLVVPESEFVLTLDADSLLLRDYCLRLVHHLQQPGNERVAVAQTPYSSFRGAGTRIERLAGASTDIQHILHQGMTNSNATFWVGANAVIRTRALEDIVETEIVDGYEIRRYVQDRTVIEDTESSIDLGAHGWSLYNYPERLSYSATPPDFGSLIVQRRRWANGGLLILPKLWRELRERRRRGEHVSVAETLLRVNYMASVAWASFGLVFLLAYPYDSRLLSPLILIAALPYFIAMGSDLRYNRYRFLDIFAIYGFNLILLPVNLAGVLKSIQQALTGRKIPFARTPKVRNRTAVPLLYAIAPVAIVVFSLLTLWRDYNAQNWGNAAFAAFNAFWASWAIVAYIGLGNLVVDVARGLTRWLYVDVNRKKRRPVHKESNSPVLNWQWVLYHGGTDAAQLAPRPGHPRVRELPTPSEMSRQH